MIKINLVFYQTITTVKESAKYLMLLFAVFASGCSENKAPAFQQSELSPGGTMTVKRLQRQSYIHPGAAVKGMQKLNFWTGFSFFRDPWVASPSSTKSRDGLGPLFNTRSCISCHDAGSRGPMAKVGESMPSSLVIKLGLRDKSNDINYQETDLTKSLTLVDPNYGDQIQPRGILFRHPKLAHAPKGEALLKLSYQTIDGLYADGSSYQLSQPKYQLTKMAYGDLADHIGLTPRFAPNIFGAGLLDAIHVDDLLAQEDVDDNNQDGISAKYNRVMNIATGTLDIGRFSLKAKHPTLAQQIAAAFRNDIGITSRLFPTESCTEQQIICQQTARLGESSNEHSHQAAFEISDKLFNLVVSFNQLLGVPPARNLTTEKVSKGREHFYQLGCQQCHTPSYRTDKNYPVEVLADQLIWPYSDLALHDMGEMLADNVKEDDANGQEWRTPPLWGIGLQKSTTKQQRFLHDGRANSISEAILWHGGEAAVAQKKFTQLTANQRQELVEFVRAI